MRVSRLDSGTGCRCRSTGCLASSSCARCCEAFLTLADRGLRCPRVHQLRFTMAKATTIKVKLVSSADTGFYYVTRKNSRTMTDKLVKKKYDPVAKKHVEFRESKIK